MSPTLLVLLLLSQAERPDDLAAGTKAFASDVLFPPGDGTLRPGAFASVGLGVDHAR